MLILSQLGSAIGYAILGVVTQLRFENVTVAISLIYLSRIIDGISGGNISTAQAYISDVTTAKDRSKGMGLLGAAFGIGFAIGPALGGIIGNDTNRASWPAYAAAAFSFTAMILSWLRLPESRPKNTTGEEIWLHPDKLMSIVRRSALFQLLMISFVAMAAFTMLEGTIGLYLNNNFRYGPNHTPYGSQQLGWYFGYLGFFIVIVQGGLMARLTKAFGEWPVAITGACLVTVGMCIYVLTGRFHTLPLLLLAGAINATGRSLQQPPIATLISKFSERSEQGAVFGLYHGLGSLARVVGPVTAGFVFEFHETAPFALAGVITLGVAIWIAMLAWSLPKPVEQTIPEADAQGAIETT